MDLPAAQHLAETLMAAHGLSDWSFQFDRAARRFGSCRPDERVITLSWKLTRLNDEAQVRETILHEIAHALAPGDGHGPQWRAACVRLGITPKRCFTDEEVALPKRRESRYEIGCAACAWWQSRHRINNRPLLCRRCKGPVIYRERVTGRSFRVVRSGRRSHVEFIDTATEERPVANNPAV